MGDLGGTRKNHKMKPRKELLTVVPYTPGVLKKGAIKLASNENPLGPSPLAMKAVKKTIQDVFIYPEGSSKVLREKLGKKLKVSPDKIIIGNGSDEIMALIAAAYVESGDEVITAEHTFSVYSAATRLFGGKMVYAKMENETFSLDNILKLINTKTKVIFICNPNNPTGTYVNDKALKLFLEKVPSRVLVVIDEAYSDYSVAKDFPKSLKFLLNNTNVLILHTFSKIFGLAGLRVGYGIASAEIIENLNKARAYPFTVNSLGQCAGIAALNDSAFAKKSVRMNEEGKKYLYHEFSKLGLEYCLTQANFIFVDIKQDCKKAFEKLMDLGVTIRPLKSFGYDTAIRVTVGTKSQNVKFIECLKKII
jgi:histidinol-phosphate aminotransferase